jgi:hypothetical protein
MFHRGVLALFTATACVAGLSACGSADDAATTPTDSPPTSNVAETTQSSPATEVVPTTESPPTIEPTTAMPPRADVLTLGLVGCDRFGFFARVDPALAQHYLPDGDELMLVDENALFSLQTLSCDDLTTDGVSHGPGHFGTAWLRVVGPESAVTLPAGSDLVAQPTDSFAPPLFQTDNESFHAAADAFGIPMTLAESMTSDPPWDGTQTGQVIDLDHDPPVSYRWSVENVNWTDDTPIGRHNLFGLDDEGVPLTYYGEFAHKRDGTATWARSNSNPARHSRTSSAPAPPAR